MMHQLDVFNDYVPRARRTDPRTSRAAAGRINGEGLAARVLAELATGPATTHELAERMGLSLVTVSPRLAPLRRHGLVTEAGKRDGRTVWRRA